ncbi:YceI family protein [Sandaracinobacteroides saxicola]|uniref:YceI family protein n=1 Tax=Sandaracinobacteroides saxicola TaxID=2759707 RepID=A0A7G5IDM2_9SPHN|nr:YceI family protein [Sandaracinobacteroides saxicola]QMW21464.1 YceI family protein [Sandaracinobacteroides saxicola]
MKAALLSLLLLASPALASGWAMVPAQSSLGFSSEWNGAVVQGRFARFSTTISFDPAKLSAARVSAVIDLTSASTGDKTVNGSLPGEDWFAVAKAREARFVGTAIVAGARPGAYVARGTLTLRGVAVPVELPFTLSIAGDVATMAGTARLDRRSFRIGMESDAAGTWVAFPVPVTVRIVARRIK